MCPHPEPGVIDEIRVLKRQSNQEEALYLLRRVYSLTKPIMRRHHWGLPILAEMMPRNSNLLGLNHNFGGKISLRLRYQANPNSFLPLEELVGTFLHELAHNNVGPHNATFYETLDGLKDEYLELRLRGFDGEGFLGKGQVLGGSVTGTSMRENVFKASVKRDAQARLFGERTRVLGGTPRPRGAIRRPVRSILADAAERRLHDELSCRSGSAAEIEEQQDESEAFGADDGVERGDVDVERNAENEKPADGTFSKPQTSGTFSKPQSSSDQQGTDTASGMKIPNENTPPHGPPTGNTHDKRKRDAKDSLEPGKMHKRDSSDYGAIQKETLVIDLTIDSD